MDWTVALVLVVLIMSMALAFCTVVSHRYTYRHKVLEAAIDSQINHQQIKERVDTLEGFVRQLMERKWYQ